MRESKSSCRRFDFAQGHILQLIHFQALYTLYSMKRRHVIQQLAAIKPLLQSQFGITKIALFGSVARDEGRETSDLDILVDFDGPAKSKQFFGAQFLIEDSLNCKVDMVTEKALRKELRPFIEKDLIVV